MAGQIIPLYPDSGTDAARVQGIPVSVVDPTTGQILQYDLATRQYVPVDYVGKAGGTFTGNLTLNGTANTAPNQTASSGSSLMTRDLVDARAEAMAYSVDSINLSPAGWAGTYVGTGWKTSNTNILDIYTGTTTGSTAIARGNAGNVSTFLGSYGIDRTLVNWSARKRFIISFAPTSHGANTTAWVSFGEQYNDTTVGDLVAKGIGIKMESLSLKVSVHNGTTLTTSGELYALVTSIKYLCEILLDGAGGWSCLLNGTLVGTGTGAPTGLSSSLYNSVSAAITNGAGVDPSRLIIDRIAKVEFL